VKSFTNWLFYFRATIEGGKKKALRSFIATSLRPLYFNQKTPDKLQLYKNLYKSQDKKS